MNTTTWSDKDLGKYDLAVVIGRFQPVHKGHMRVIEKARSVADRTLIIVGSAFAARNIKNPFTYDERVQLLERAIDGPGVLFAPVPDYMYDLTKWLGAVQHAVKMNSNDGVRGSKPRICIVGHHRDLSSSYLDMFPTWDKIEVDDVDGTNATSIREALFTLDYSTVLENIPNAACGAFIQRFMTSPSFNNLVEEHKFIKKYKEQFAKLPYPPTFVTVDAVVTCLGHVLLVRRGANPGKGLLALPGGFININETVKESMFRELHEETKIKISDRELDAHLCYEKVFDHPDRSLRGRTVTHAGLISLPSSQFTKLPAIKGSDDAADAIWFPIGQLEDIQSQMYEDHFSIVTHMINRTR